MGAARLAILPGLTHYNIFMAPVLAEAVAGFLDGGSAAEWTGAQ